MTKIAVIGTGYVGLTTGACFAHMGHQVICADIDPVKIESLRRGVIPIVELGLQELVEEGLAEGRLSFVLGAAIAAADCEIAFLCVPTPQGDDGSADLSYIEAAARQIGPVLPYEAIVVNKSTVPVGSARVVERVMGRPDVKVVSNPEFLREGSAVQDFLKPDRVIVGCDDQAAALKVSSLYDGISAPVIVTDPASAETIKYAANAFLATKLSFINAIAAICEGVGADVNDVVVGMGSDKRIGQDFLRPGPGWGGSCFDGAETCIVRDHDGSRLTRFDALGTLDIDHLEILSWSNGQVIPEFQRALATMQRPYSGEVVKIRTKMGRRVTVTADHPMVVRSANDETLIKLAGELTTDDWLPISLGAPLCDALGPEHASMIEAIEPAGLAWRDIIVRLNDEQMHAARKVDGALPSSRRWDYRRNRTLRLTEAAQLRLPLTGTLFGSATNGTYVPANIELTDELWEVLGLFLAEGHIGTDGARRRVCWSFHPNAEQHLVDFVADYWRRLGVKTTVRRMLTSMQVSISSRLLASWFEHVLGVGTNCYSHRIPDVVWSASESAKQAVLRGLWAGDGSWSLLNGGPSVALEYGTVSPQLADGMLRLLGEFGIVARQKIARGTKSTVDTHWFVISGADQIEDCMWLLEPHERDQVRGQLDAQSKRIAPTGYRRDRKGTAWVRIADVQTRYGEQQVFSVEVDRNHTVVTTGGLVAHNCFPKDSRALLKIAREAGYHFDLLDGVITINEEQFERVTDKIRVAAGGDLSKATVAVWGLTFKARTDDLRDSPSLAIIKRLVAAGATVQAYDPTVDGPKPGLPSDITIADSAYTACKGADVLAVLTEWDEFRWLDIDQVAGEMTGRAIVDARNLLDRNDWRRASFDYQGIGR
ncbi:MAG: nucleotide sugar dehydrogenase [Ilumatobacteraceae bacterium]|nr:nucleotide sugar dehydrogenase [Ilumatobacteraceae bacterium]